MNEFHKVTASKIARLSGYTVAQLGLRFDRVAMHFLNSVEKRVRRMMPTGNVLIVTITAPIRKATDTALQLEAEITELAASGKLSRIKSITINDNHISLVLVRSAKKAKVIGFVHNPGTKAKQLIDFGRDFLSPTDAGS